MKTIALIYRVLSGNASDKETLELEQWRSLSDTNRAEYEDIKTLWEYSRAPVEGAAISDEVHREGWQKIRQHIQNIQLRRKRKHMMIVVAIILVVLGVIGWLSYDQGKQDKPSLHGYHRIIGPQPSRS